MLQDCSPSCDVQTSIRMSTPAANGLEPRGSRSTTVDVKRKLEEEYRSLRQPRCAVIRARPRDGDRVETHAEPNTAVARPEVVASEKLLLLRPEEKGLQRYHRREYGDDGGYARMSHMTIDPFAMSDAQRKQVLQQLPWHTLPGCEECSLAATEIYVLSEEGKIIDWKVPTLLDTGSQSSIMLESRARKLKWQPAIGAEADEMVNLPPLYGVSGKPIVSLGVYRMRAMTFGFDKVPKWFRAELQVVSDNEVLKDTESVILDAALIKHKNLLNGWSANACVCMMSN